MHDRADSNSLMTVNEVAEYLRVSTSTIWRWLREGKLSSIKIGNSRRFQREDIMRMAGVEPNSVAESGTEYGSIRDYAAGSNGSMHSRMLVLNQLRQRLQESRLTDDELAGKVEQNNTEHLYPATCALAEIRRERLDSLSNGGD